MSAAKINAALAAALPSPGGLSLTTEPLVISGRKMKEMTTADSVRAVMGISESELPDDVLRQTIYASTVERALTKLTPDVVTNWAKLLTSVDPKDQDLVELVKDYCTFKVAVQACQSIDLVAARTLTDSKATFQRFEVDLSELTANLQANLASLESELKGVLGIVVERVARIPLIGEGKPLFDPVTNEGA